MPGSTPKAHFPSAPLLGNNLAHHVQLGLTMTDISCGCGSQRTITTEDIAACQKVANGVFLKVKVSTTGGRSGVFANGRIVGHYLTAEEDNWNNTVISVPFAFGVLAVHVIVKKRQKELSIDLPDLEFNLFSSRDPRSLDSLVQADLVLFEDAAGTPSVKVDRSRFHLPFKKYDWSCLRQCAPSCLSCFDDIQCWVICAGSCVISCAL